MDNVFAFHCDACAINPAAYNATLSVLHPYADLNLRWCHGNNNTRTGAKLDTAIALDKFMAEWNSCMGHSEAARVLFLKHTGKAAKTKSETRLWSENDVVEHCVFPNILNGKLPEWLLACLAKELAPKPVARMLAEITNPRRRTWLALEAATEQQRPIIGLA